ncbi:hypothetical protein [Steroidobacter cummioxidans]|uniref:hypothetical protein n=1 Tax=Steroidobacter cummioxidans TaxID=1803913 RepID=UPI000E30CD24|nr:hypothetical protein [Steroidobacter cummioxidans]
MKTKRLLSLFALLSLAGCAQIGGTTFLMDQTFAQRVGAAPDVESLTKQVYATSSQPSEIEIYYVSWNPLTTPDLVKDWEYHYKISEASKPGYPYTRIAKLTYYAETRDDVSALSVLRESASKLGGDAIIDVFRNPAIETVSTPARILGYRYFATVVKNKEKVEGAKTGRALR